MKLLLLLSSLFPLNSSAQSQFIFVVALLHHQQINGLNKTDDNFAAAATAIDDTNHENVLSKFQGIISWIIKLDYPTLLEFQT